MWRRREACTDSTVLKHEQNQSFQLEGLTMGKKRKEVMMCACTHLLEGEKSPI